MKRRKNRSSAVFNPKFLKLLAEQLQLESWTPCMLCVFIIPKHKCNQIILHPVHCRTIHVEHFKLCSLAYCHRVSMVATFMFHAHKESFYLGGRSAGMEHTLVQPSIFSIFLTFFLLTFSYCVSFYRSLRALKHLFMSDIEIKLHRCVHVLRLPFRA